MHIVLFYDLHHHLQTTFVVFVILYLCFFLNTLVFLYLTIQHDSQKKRNMWNINFERNFSKKVLYIYYCCNCILNFRNIAQIINY